MNQVLIVLVVFSVFLLGVLAGKSQTRTTAIKAGVAEYYLDQDFDKTFRFKSCTPNVETPLKHR